MPVNCTLVQMIEACNWVGSIEHHTAALAGAFTSALKIGQMVIGDKRCYRCHTIGHLAADCPQRESAIGRSAGLALGQQVSFKIQRGRTASANVAGKREAEREAGTRDDTSSIDPRTGRAVHTGLPSKGNDGQKFTIGCRDNNATDIVTMDTLSPRTRGSAGLDVAMVTDFTLWGSHVQKIPLNVKGPLGQGYSALSLGRSSTTLTGLFVLPGVIDADFTGQIQAMVWTPSPPVFIPRKTRIAQLILFKAAENCDRCDAGFGSTGPPAIFWATQIATTRPMLTVTLYNPHTSPACVQLPVLIDTGADVTVLALKDCPRSWPLATPTEGLVGVGGTSHTFQSINSLTIKTQEGSTFTVRPYVTNLPMSLLGRDVMAQENVAVLQELVAEQLQQGHITPTTSPWNSPVFIIKKKSGKWRLLHYLRQINKVIEEMGSLQPGLPSLTMIPQNWDIVVTDLKDCFFTIPLHPADAPRFAFSVPKVNRGEPMDRYHWTVLPQGMKNSPTICQVYVAEAIRPVRLRFPEMYIYHYMDDILLASPTNNQVQEALPVLRSVLQNRGLQIAPEKIQMEAPWKYLGWKILQQTIQPQNVAISTDIKTLNDVQKLLGNINWIRTQCGIDNETLAPLFELLKGDTDLNAPRQWTTAAKDALRTLYVCNQEQQPLAIIGQWEARERDPLILLEWVVLPYQPTKTLVTRIELFAALIKRGRERIVEMTGKEPELIILPVVKNYLN
ncbi:hypothetical protein QYF61_004634 [Mycteria americana]|uniref:ribonuclease H n=1 Tax=Mycteria americana TaxID=33587 RepID=A0AAN7MV74_MYCAM|nr:hypothetical protein QYF61_004634 [Mycteria americana]